MLHLPKLYLWAAKNKLDLSVIIHSSHIAAGNEQKNTFTEEKIPDCFATKAAVNGVRMMLVHFNCLGYLIFNLYSPRKGVWGLVSFNP